MKHKTSGYFRRSLLQRHGLVVDLEELVHLLAWGVDVDLDAIPRGVVGLDRQLGACDVALAKGEVSERTSRRRRCRIGLGMFASLAVAGSLAAALGGVDAPA
jgi:hypothetical protein